MKKILLLLLLVLFVPSLTARELNREWRAYYRLSRKDRPRDQLAKLHEIREIALDRRLPDDLLDACREEKRVYSRMNWKSEDSLSAALLKVVESYGEPLLTYRWLGDDWEYAKAHRDALSAGYHPVLQNRRISFLQNRNAEEIADDFEWILWDRVTRFTRLPADSEEFPLLEEKVGDRYPARPYLEYLKAMRAEDRLSAMQALSEQYAGDPFRFIPEKMVLQERMNRILENTNTTEVEAQSLYEDAWAFSQAVKAEKGVHQRMDLSVDEIRRTLRESRVWIAFVNDSIILTGRNFGRGTLTFRSDQVHKTVTLRNRDGRFYALDTVKAPVPTLPDGSYRVSAEDYATASYRKHTLSMAVRQQKDGFAVYVTDYQTGEPVPSATLRLSRGKKVLEREIPLNGFTPLPADFQKMIGRKVNTLQAQIGERRSPRISVLKLEPSVAVPAATLHGRVFKDRGAYRPGDTLKGKAVLFKGDLRKRVNTMGKGEDVRVKIFNAEGKTLTEIDLKTNAFGSVAWEWPIPVGERNGLFGIYVYYNGDNVTHTEFRVDDFVLPTFEVTFDPQETPYLSDTDFEIGGKVASYSGHPVDGISLEGTVIRYGREEWKGAVAIDGDGSFRVPLRLPDVGNYRLVLKAVDATGETRTFEHSFEVSVLLSLSVELENAARGDFSFRSATLQKTVLTESFARFAWTVKNGSQEVRMPVFYQLVDANGKKLLEGTAEEETLELDLSASPDGLYFLYGFVKAGNYQGRVSCPVLKITSGLDAPVRSVFLPGGTEIEYGDRIQARFGAGDGPLWAVATLSAPDGTVLESRLVHLDGDRSLMDLPFIYKGTYPDAVSLEMFYFRDAEQVFHKAVYHRVRHEMDLPLSFSRFVDRTMPGAPCTLSLQTEPGVEAAVAVFDKSLDAIHPNRWQGVELQKPTFVPTWFRSGAGLISGQRRRNAAGGTVAIEGLVLDQAGLPIIGAAVIVEGGGRGAVTDQDGRFSLEVPAGTQLEITSIGYQTVYAAAYSGMEVILREDVQYLEEAVVVGYGSQLKGLLTGRVAGVRVRGAASTKRNTEPAIYGLRAPVYAEEEKAVLPDVPDEAYREIFSEALAFEPFLYPDETGKVDVSFRTSDKTSSYHVYVFAHDATMRNAVLRRDFVVTIPVRISVTPPRYLYENDGYELSAVVSSISDDPISGRLYLQVNEGEELQSTQVADLTVPAGGTASAVYSVAAPFLDGKALDLKMVFESDSFSDAVRLSVPVYRAAQSLTEVHSALAGPEAVDSLRRMFVNIPGEQAEVRVRTLREVVEAGLSEWTDPEDPDALSLSADFYARSLLGRDTTGTLKPLLALRREDGGFAWMDGMESSPVVTATLLERFAVLRDKGLPIPDMEAAVRFLDRSQFGNWFPMWCGGLSDEQYMDIRAMWASVPFDLTGVEEKAVRRFRLREFRRFARAYLTPGRYDYANGWILDRARRVRTLQNLTASEAGLALGKAWGEQILTASRFQKSIANDLETLRQYAVRHPSGALYYPNAVLPFRGLLSSEAYAHTLLSGLLDGPVSDGVKLWLVLQNETQSWTGNPAYVDALQTVLTASDSLLDRQIVTLTASSAVPFERIKAAGNGMRVERKFYLEKDGKRTEVQPGDSLQVGDRLIARYELWSAENRSFVRIDAFREANLLPAEQRSGPARVSFDPIRIDGVWTRIAQCYRDVRIDKTSWWLDVCPEEKSAWEEALFVNQAGTFSAPVITVESLYAPDYRANGAFRGPLNSQLYD